MEQRCFNFLSLPLEILVKIVSLLSQHDSAQVARTSKLLLTTYNSVLQERTFLDLKGAGAVLNDECFATLGSKTGPKLKRIELDCWHLSDSSMISLPEGIEELTLSGCDHHSDSFLLNAVERLGDGLKLFAWSGFGGSVSTFGFEALSNKCRNIKSFMIDAGRAVDVNRIVCEVANNCPVISEISAYDLTKETLMTISSCNVKLKRFRHKRRHDGGLLISDATIFALCMISPFLEELELVDKIIAQTSEVLTDSGLLALAAKGSTLCTLKLKLASSEHAQFCSEVGIMELFSACNKTSKVQLSNFKCLGDPPVYELVQRCSTLRDLNLEGTMITDGSLELIVNCCQHLCSISVKCCKRLTDAGLKSLGNCGSLKALNVGHTSCLNDGATTAICLGNPGLKSVVFSYGQISDKSLRYVAMCSRLEELALNNCFRVTNAGLAFIAKSCPRLRYLSLSYCEQVSDSGIHGLAHGCQQLLKVRLDGCRLLSNPSVAALCKNNLKLRYISMQYCTKISDAVFDHLVGARSLRFVNLGRAKLTQFAIESFHAQRPLVDLFIDGRPCSSYSAGDFPWR